MEIISKVLESNKEPDVKMLGFVVSIEYFHIITL
jgi:hypothetical protein